MALAASRADGAPAREPGAAGETPGCRRPESLGLRWIERAGGITCRKGGTTSRSGEPSRLSFTGDRGGRRCFIPCPRPWARIQPGAARGAPRRFKSARDPVLLPAAFVAAARRPCRSAVSGPGFRVCPRAPRALAPSARQPGRGTSTKSRKAPGSNPSDLAYVNSKYAPGTSSSNAPKSSRTMSIASPWLSYWWTIRIWTCPLPRSQASKIRWTSRCKTSCVAAAERLPASAPGTGYANPSASDKHIRAPPTRAGRIYGARSTCRAPDPRFGCPKARLGRATASPPRAPGRVRPAYFPVTLLRMAP